MRGISRMRGRISGRTCRDESMNAEVRNMKKEFVFVLHSHASFRYRLRDFARYTLQQQRVVHQQRPPAPSKTI